eukprot:jgi/Mesvir1/15252/Mv06473-RA.1
MPKNSPKRSPSPSPRRARKYKLSKEEIDDYVQCTPFNKQEILRLHERFQSLSAENLTRLTYEEVLRIDELQANPFAPRICELFSGDGSRCLTFAQFLDMMTAFSHRTPLEVKMVWAFALWDFNGDDNLNADDIRTGLRLVTSTPTQEHAAVLSGRASRRMTLGMNMQLSEAETDDVLAKILNEIDPAKLGVSFNDFCSILARCQPSQHDEWNRNCDNGLILSNSLDLCNHCGVMLVLWKRGSVRLHD